MAREWEGLAIGSVIGGQGPRESEWASAIRRLAVRIMNLGEDVISPFAVNVVFHVPGEIGAPDYDQPRTGKYSKHDATIMIQVPIPDMPVPRHVDGLLVNECRRAIDLAESFGLRKGIVDRPLDELRSLMDKVEASLASDFQ
jgi:hypothetical protein